MRDVGMQLKAVADAAKTPWADMGTLWKFGKYMAGKVAKPQVPVKSALIQEEAEQLSSAVRRFGLAIPRLLAKYREKVVEKQLELNRISEASMQLYAIAAVLSKLDSDLEAVNGKVEALGTDVDVAKFFCKRSFALIEESLTCLISNDDDEVDALSDKITGLSSK
jgi:hypothetical protein